MVTGSPSIALKIASKSLRCMGSKFRQRGFAVFQRIGEDHLAHGDDAVGFEEHMLGAAKADAFGAEAPRRRRIVRRVGIGANLQCADRNPPSPSAWRNRRSVPARASARGL